MQDSLAPDRIVLGVACDRAEARLRQVYRAPLEAGTPLLVMDLETAELVKVAANAFLATKISFINAMAEICEEAGADVIPLAEALGYDARIGRRFLSPGLGYGGGCLPKDIRGFRATAAELGVSSLVSLLGTVDAINLGRRDRVVALARQAAGGSLAGRRVAVLGVAFKPDSDDVPGFPQPGRLRPAGGRGSDRVRARPGGHAQRGRQTAGPAVRTVGIGGGRGGRSGPAPHRVVRLPGHRPRRPGRGRRPASDHRRALLPRRGLVAQGWLVRARPRAAPVEWTTRPGDLSPPRRVWGDIAPRGVWGDGSPQDRAGSWRVVPPASRLRRSTTLASSMARVIGPTPPGMGASHPATSATSAATSPTSLGRSRPSG